MKRTASILLSTLVVLSFYSIGCTERNQDSTAAQAVDDHAAASPRDRIMPILDDPDRLRRVESLIIALRAIPPSEIGSIRDVLRDSDLFFRELERVLLVARWAEEDPIAATDWAVRGERGAARNAAIREAVQAWAEQDPEAIVQNYDVETIGAKLPSMLTGLVAGWFDSGVDGVEDFVFSLGDPDVRAVAEKELARVVVTRRGGEEAIVWAQGIRRGERVKAPFYRMLAGNVAKNEPEVAVAWCDRVCDLEVGKLITQAIARSWGRRDGAKMMDWLLTRPDQRETWLSARIGYREFVMDDEENAYKWMEGTSLDQRKGKILQGPVSMYLNKKAWTDPKTAIDWTDYISNDDERSALKISIARRWLNQDKDAAEAWLATSPLSEEERAKAHENLYRKKNG